MSLLAALRFHDYPGDCPEDAFLDAAFAEDERLGGVHGLVAAVPGGGRIPMDAIMRHAAADGIATKMHNGYLTRGNPVMAGVRKGVMVHWTASKASAKNPHPSLVICRDGRPKYPGMPAVPGPLVQWDIDWNGVIHCLATGRANHAGMVDKRFLDMLGRPLPDRIKPGPDTGGTGGFMYGIEVENRGGGAPFTAAQQVSLRWLIQSICATEGWNPAWRTVDHCEATTRKVDITKPGVPWATPGAFRADFAKRTYLLTTGPDKDKIVMPLTETTARHIDGPTAMALYAGRYRDPKTGLVDTHPWTQVPYERTDLRLVA